jgi:hypothetical protein
MRAFRMLILETGRSRPGELDSDSFLLPQTRGASGFNTAGLGLGVTSTSRLSHCSSPPSAGSISPFLPPISTDF